jgi:hypothetical protein
MELGIIYPPMPLVIENDSNSFLCPPTLLFPASAEQTTPPPGLHTPIPSSHYGTCARARTRWDLHARPSPTSGSAAAGLHAPVHHRSGAMVCAKAGIERVLWMEAWWSNYARSRSPRSSSASPRACRHGERRGRNRARVVDGGRGG